MANDKGRQGHREVEAQPQEGAWEEVDERTLHGEYTRTENSKASSGINEIPTDYSRRVRVGLIVLLVTFVGAGGWAAFAPLDGAAIAPGRVIVESQNRVVQHLEGGIIDGLMVRDGSRVSHGDPLVILSDTKPRAELNIVESQLREELGREARLRAERVGAKKISFPDELTEQDSSAARNIIEGQEGLFKSRTEALEGQLSIYKQRIKALAQQINGLRAMNRTLDSRVASYEEELSNWQELFDQELADRNRINEMQRELYRLQGEKSGNDSRLAELEIKIGETESEALVTKQNYAEEVSEQLRESQRNVADLRARRTALQDTLNRTTILSPVTGTVVGLAVHTVGGIVRPGDTLMEIVPSDQEFTIQARVQPQDIDRVAVGQKADVRLSAFNQQTADIIEGEVLGLSADSLKVENGEERYYEAKIEITQQGLETMQAQGMYLVPGMPADIMIKTGERTALQYLLDPVTHMVERAFREE
ncbi:HlyD family type I secretion periplasmic adaptor subunit [Marinobacter sp. S6332]|uniref:HlyD family type I secretion periplasmic adaptor subunit n=1 Tax=Marinobacter sp. S6332 TaxID=2926403 RepID=UPI001FF55C00|nr:HlyD family type I secretion periplasmic adaptor subunit [Marinobacter sp. S6332]MCK0163723.1 HlyD family type I secretion periplasmic adaptor subunit [Marinobacter sp. S6332]